MKAADIPDKFPIPFAYAAGAGYIRPIPKDSQIGIQDGAASLHDGFPPYTMAPPGYPFGQDFNGILQQISAWSRWQGAQGPVAYDSTFSTSIGGYPKGAIVAAAILGNFWLCKIDDNTSNPDTGGANWLSFTPIPLYAVDAGTANAVSATLPVAFSTLASLTGRPLQIKKISSANTGPATLAINGLAATAIVHQNGTALASGELPASGILTVAYDGTNFQLLGGSSGVTALQLQAQAGNYAVDSGTANAMVIVLSTVPISLASLAGAPIRIKKGSAANTGAVTLKVNTFTAAAVVHLNGLPLNLNELPANSIFEVIYDSGSGKFFYAAMPASPLFFKVYFTSPLALTGGGQVIAPTLHSLGGVPNLIQAYLICIGTDAGYNVGEYIPLPPFARNDNNKQYGVTVWASSSQIGAQVGATGIGVANKGDGELAVLTLDGGHWEIFMQAWL